MSKENIHSFEQIPFAINKIFDELETIKEQLLQVGLNQNKQLIKPEKKILTVGDICELLHMEKSTVYNQTHLNKIPHYKANGRVYFDSVEIDKWIHANKRKTIKELQDEANLQLRK